MAYNYPASNQDSTWTLLAISAGLIIIPVIIWMSLHTWISFAVIQGCALIFKVMLLIHSFFVEQGVNTILYFIVPKEAFGKASNWLEVLPKLHYAGLTVNDLYKALTVVGLFLRIPVIAFLIYLIRKVYVKTAPGRLIRVLNLLQIAKINSVFFPQIKPALLENLLKQNLDSGPFAREVSPIRFVVFHEAAYILEEAKFRSNEGNPLKRIITFDATKSDNINYIVVKDKIEDIVSKVHKKLYVDKETISELFTEQLGDRWRGVDALPYHLKGLYAAFIAHLNGDKKNAQAFLSRMNRSYRIKKQFGKPPVYSISIKGYEKLIKKHESSETIQILLTKHAYVTTLFSGLLDQARKKGKLTCPDFLWLKVLDRTMWFTLNHVGCQTAWTEAAGPFSHYLIEKKVGSPVIQPFIQKAVESLIEYLDNTEGWLAQSTASKDDEPFTIF